MTTFENGLAPVGAPMTWQIMDPLGKPHIYSLFDARGLYIETPSLQTANEICRAFYQAKLAVGAEDLVNRLVSYTYNDGIPRHGAAS